MMAPWSAAVWIQSIHGRRFIASTGPVAPRNQDRHAVAPGVEDRHGGVEQADVGVHRAAIALPVTLA
jgi:hypothetical protein